MKTENLQAAGGDTLSTQTQLFYVFVASTPSPLTYKLRNKHTWYSVHREQGLHAAHGTRLQDCYPIHSTCYALNKAKTRQADFLGVRDRLGEGEPTREPAESASEPRLADSRARGARTHGHRHASGPRRWHLHLASFRRAVSKKSLISSILRGYKIRHGKQPANVLYLAVASAPARPGDPRPAAPAPTSPGGPGGPDSP